MGFIKDVSNQKLVEPFPGATFEVSGIVPIVQCSEAKIEGDDATVIAGPPILQDTGAFTGWNLAFKKCTITAGIGVTPGTYGISNNGDNWLMLNAHPGPGTEVVYYIHNGGSLILTRDAPSFAEYAREHGYAYTFKGGQLFTNMPENELRHACTILWDPIT